LILDFHQDFLIKEEQRLVGRDKEIQTLHNALLSLTKQQYGSITVIEGEEGLGNPTEDQ